MKRFLVFLALAAIGGGGWWWYKNRQQAPQITYREVRVGRDTIRLSVQATGVIQPQNRIEIIPPVTGRLEEVLVREGDRVEAGQILAWMSSNERAVMLDAATARGPEEVKKWKEIYKALPLIAPLSGTIIARNMEPGQRVTTTPVFVMSNELIVKAQVDETDIGKIKVDDAAIIGLDAYPDVKVLGRVNHIAYEAKTVSNVTMYDVEVLPLRVPQVFRSGMTANVVVVVEERDGVLSIPAAAVIQKNGGSFVRLRDRRMGKIQIGITDGKHVEVTEGLSRGDVVLVEELGGVWAKPAEGPTNPFMMGGRQRRGGGGGGRFR